MRDEHKRGKTWRASMKKEKQSTLQNGTRRLKNIAKKEWQKLTISFLKNKKCHQKINTLSFFDDICDKIMRKIK